MKKKCYWMPEAPALHLPREWDLPESEITLEDVYLNRRKFLEGMGHSGLAVMAGWLLPVTVRAKTSEKESITAESLTGGFNNFYEFTPDKARVRQMAKQLPLAGWSIQIKGLVQQPRVVDIADLIRKFDHEERIYRLRCVETWSAVIPWTGFPLRRLIELAQPLSQARFVKFTTFSNPNIMPGQKDRFWEPWPYVEGLSLAEAMHDLSFMATGMYGHSLNPQNGAPIRLVVPWKYGFKSIKSIVEMEFTREAPRTFWQDMSPLEYDFEANVVPQVPYARWHQSVETRLGENRTVATLLYNGYANQVASLYK